VRDAADADGQNVSAWFAGAARRQLANRGLRDVVAAWEREHGAFSDEERAAARALTFDEAAGNGSANLRRLRRIVAEPIRVGMA
jgi:hypothetical protein